MYLNVMGILQFGVNPAAHVTKTSREQEREKVNVVQKEEMHPQ